MMRARLQWSNGERMPALEAGSQLNLFFEHIERAKRALCFYIYYQISSFSSLSSGGTLEPRLAVQDKTPNMGRFESLRKKFLNDIYLKKGKGSSSEKDAKVSTMLFNGIGEPRAQSSSRTYTLMQTCVCVPNTGK